MLPTRAIEDVLLFDVPVPFTVRLGLRPRVENQGDPPVLVTLKADGDLSDRGVSVARPLVLRGVKGFYSMQDIRVNFLEVFTKIELHDMVSWKNF